MKNDAPAPVSASIKLFRMIPEFVGAASGPFVFKAAGLQDFPAPHISHLLIMVCYVIGAATGMRLLASGAARVISRFRPEASGSQA